MNSLKSEMEKYESWIACPAMPDELLDEHGTTLFTATWLSVPAGSAASSAQEPTG